MVTLASQFLHKVEIRTMGCLLEPPLVLAPPATALGEGVLDSSSTVAGEGSVTRAVVTEVTGLEEDVVAFSWREGGRSVGVFLDDVPMDEGGRSDLSRIWMSFSSSGSSPLPISSRLCFCVEDRWVHVNYIAKVTTRVKVKLTPMRNYIVLLLCVECERRK